ncbi:Plasmid maintenance system killer [mine drainage metagenome]|uniref:Plasmid maintenance system killer n=1 Tax=mine drainage metagenome TaxID=410659 RepID=T1C0E3_9ZZZZ
MLGSMIKGYRDKRTASLGRGERVARLPQDIQRRARMRLDRINAAVRLEDLRIPPSHCLEALKHDRAGQWSIRVNDRWRICFHWENGDAYDVELVDYH